MKITLKMLEGACESQRDLFAKLFGQEVELTLELCIDHAQKFNWHWAAQNLLPPKARADYYKALASAGADYDNAIATARADYDKALAPALAAYNKAIDTAAYNQALSTARAAYYKARAPASEAYYKAIATAFFNAATMEEK